MQDLDPRDVAAQLDQMDAIAPMVELVPQERRTALVLRSLKGVLGIADILLQVVGALPEEILPPELGPEEIALLRNVWLMHDKVAKVIGDGEA